MFLSSKCNWKVFVNAEKVLLILKTLMFEEAAIRLARIML